MVEIEAAQALSERQKIALEGIADVAAAGDDRPGEALDATAGALAREPNSEGSSMHAGGL